MDPDLVQRLLGATTIDEILQRQSLGGLAFSVRCPNNPMIATDEEFEGIRKRIVDHVERLRGES